MANIQVQNKIISEIKTSQFVDNKKIIEIGIPGFNSFPKSSIIQSTVKLIKNNAEKVYNQKLKNKYNILDFRGGSLFGIIYFYLFKHDSIALYEIFKALLFQKHQDQRPKKYTKKIQFNLARKSRILLKRTMLFQAIGEADND